jgi:2-methylaconitate cis-trans-isomerase PrpF
MRGGTSRALFFRDEHLPPPGPERERWLQLALGSHDPQRIDGLAGSQVNTAKIAVVSASTRPGVDVDYLVGLVSGDRPEIHYKNICGNILAAVGPYAIEAGWVKDPARVRIFNLNEQILLQAEVPVNPQGEARVRGDYQMDGVPGSGAPIFLNFAQAVGPGLWPTGQTQEDLGGVPVTICHAGSLCVLVRAEWLGVTGHESPAELNAHPEFLPRASQLHQLAGERLGVVAPGEPNTTSTPFVVCVAAGQDLVVRVVGLGRCHPALAASTAITLGAACHAEGTILPSVDRQELTLVHPLGSMTVTARPATSSPLRFERLGYYRTARKLMQGEIYLPL